MDFLKKFIKHKTTIQDVLSSLVQFDNDMKSLNEFKKKATEYFGLNWKFNLEVYISSLPKDDKDKLYPLFKGVLEYEKGLFIWTSAMQIVKGVKPLSADVLKNMPEYKKYLEKFGIEGTRLYEKLSDLLDINTPTQNVEDVQIISNNETEETSFDDAENNEVIEEKIENIKDIEVVESSEDEDEEEQDRDEEEEEIVKTPKQEEYTQKLKQRILQKMQDIEARKASSSSVSSPSSSVEKEESIVIEKEENNPSSEKNKILKKVRNIDKTKEIIIDTDNSNDWLLKNFVKVHNFLSNSREVMSAISLYKNAQSLEEYPYYGFILDTIDYMIEQGEKILNDKSDAEIFAYFPNGRKEVKDLISSYKEQKNNEIIIPTEELQTKQDIQKILNSNK